MILRFALAALLFVPGCSDGPPARGEAHPPPFEHGASEEPEFEPGPVLRTAGLDSTLLARAVETATDQGQLHTMLVARGGELLVERHLRGPGLDRPANVKSISKTLLAAITGYAVEAGYLEGIEVPVLAFFPEHAEGLEATHGAITVEHLLTMSSGLQSTSFNNYGAWVVSPNWVRSALRREMVFEPGTRMLYSTGNSHLVSAILARASGRSTLSLAREALGEPLGIQLPAWPTDPQGVHFGGNDMLISPRGLLRFGEMTRKGGVHEGRRVLAERWIDDAWQVRVRSSRDGNGYALGWWHRESSGFDVWFAWGYGGQFLFVVPELEMTVVFTSDPWSRERGHNQVLHRVVDRFLVPAAVETTD